MWLDPIHRTQPITTGNGSTLARETIERANEARVANRPGLRAVAGQVQRALKVHGRMFQSDHRFIRLFCRICIRQYPDSTPVPVP